MVLLLLHHFFLFDSLQTIGRERIFHILASGTKQTILFIYFGIVFHSMSSFLSPFFISHIFVAAAAAAVCDFIFVVDILPIGKHFAAAASSTQLDACQCT